MLRDCGVLCCGRAFQEEAKLLYKRQNKRTREKVSNPINIPESEPNWLTTGKFKGTEFNPIHNRPDDKVSNCQIDDVPIALKIFEFQTKTQMKKIMDNIKPLLNADIDHENILKYHGVEKDIANNCIYLRLDFYNGTLQQAVYNRLEGIYLDDSVSLQILRQITEGVAHLHQNKIAHKNLNLGNIFIFKKSDSEICAKISDAGVDNPKSDCESFNGIPIWKAPEFETDQKVTGACDLFSLGCIFHFVLTGGKYPFGDSNQKGFLKEVEYPRIPEVVLSNLWLIRELTLEDPKKRPKVKDILSHPIFWTSEKTLNFFIQIASLIEKVASKDDEEEETPNEISDVKVKKIVSEMETNYKRVVTKRFGYHQHLQSYRDWLKFMGMDKYKYRATYVRSVYKTFKTNKVCEFIELIRNLGTDFEEFPQHVKNVVGKPPDEFLGYWRHQFPLLVPMLWILFQKLRSEDEYEMKQFYGNRHKFSFQSESLYCYANNEMFLSVKEGTLLQKNVERLSTLSI
ncbi:unnamed protein product [Orchesella dallaii]|uniref:Protein kinase domain-containing protein n=1 Tax=Orchesella dallaii TaxID=48710 RepID=A0ABP1S0F8_9HEXA